MLNNIGISGLVIIFMLALMLFGPAKLPQLGRAFGDTLREFRNSTRGLADDGKEDEDRETIELKKLP
ncbi:MAG: twin-arginine translocase TatA/TatE family subunit [Paenibacillus dendritiformis]|uniref:twin-arginine translocase TatA/TatE family subunit n=1 Tax=Paenibacillus dendritiformis TaxID=130049 RepID=UPI00143DB2B1|nr:twin-arginine translocase TatA/TatE family subunit [Paenibacillus dendritiformis]MDU5145129.1 twin-arginine translocase TatA/TatE family subunit [Paenibacillus dendritiformis]NKI24435.1 twin-arginine translocase TatA/TatE family subunit [Paenibacillus dendritiformis]NRF99311.1 twin-arginine translocase TatA/TatE family subunit [Paenibacillus dendritiformis]GIO75264.1 Sec-independent protein translocase protein TatAd [Paenibacillus dendritiformis]